MKFHYWTIHLYFQYYYKNGNNDYIGEGVTQLEHMTQSAMIAEEENQPQATTEINDAKNIEDIEHPSVREAIKKYGVTRHHRKTFSPILNLK